MNAGDTIFFVDHFRPVVKILAEIGGIIFLCIIICAVCSKVDKDPHL